VLVGDVAAVGEAAGLASGVRLALAGVVVAAAVPAPPPSSSSSSPQAANMPATSTSASSGPAKRSHRGVICFPLILRQCLHRLQTHNL
jgi:hypothetical protein